MERMHDFFRGLDLDLQACTSRNRARHLPKAFYEMRACSLIRQASAFGFLRAFVRRNRFIAPYDHTEYYIDNSFY